MKRPATSIIIGLLAGMSGIAHGGTIASAPMLAIGIPNADQAACYIRNVGTTPVDVSVQLAVGVPAPTFDTCNTSPLAPGRTCVILRDGPLGFAECTVTSSVSARRLRGTAELRLATPSGFQVWSAQDLQ